MKKIMLAAFSCVICCSLGAQAPQTSQPPSNHEALLDRTLELAKGNATFRSVFFKEHEAEFVRLAREGQTPRALFIGCSDSRVMPELMTNTPPGQLFVIRNAGNFVPNFDEAIAWDGIAASIEYAVDVLGVKEIIVCGHSHCGAVKALFSPAPENPSPSMRTIGKWLQFGQQARNLTQLSVPKETSDEERYAVAERLSVIFQLEHLLTYPNIKQKVADQTIYLHGWFVDIETGKLWYYNPNEVDFLPIDSIAKK